MTTKAELIESNLDIISACYKMRPILDKMEKFLDRDLTDQAITPLAANKIRTDIKQLEKVKSTLENAVESLKPNVSETAMKGYKEVSEKIERIAKRALEIANPTSKL